MLLSSKATLKPRRFTIPLVSFLCSFFRRVSAFTHSYTLYAGQTLIEAFKAFMSFEDQVCFTLSIKGYHK